MEREKIEKILELHEKWLNNETGGVKANLRGADLRGTDLSDTNLHGANLRHANLIKTDLRGADLIDADLHGANLRHANLIKTDLSYADLHGACLCNADLHGACLCNADLCNANLRGANLRGANLRGANLHGANLRHANLSGTDLSDTNLCDADLRDADLCNANLRDADLSGADLRSAKLCDTDLSYIDINEITTAVLLACPEEGSFTAYKKASGKIVVLEIPADAKRSSATTLKCRCDKAKVLRIEELDGTISDTKEVASSHSINFIYKVGEIVSVDDFDDNRWNECSQGIHFFINKGLARQY